MSSVKRIISGTTQGFVKNFLNLIISIISLPIYLTYWNIELYSSWIIILTITSIIKLPLLSHQAYLGQEFVNLGSAKKKQISKILFGSILMNFIMLIIIILLSYLILYFTELLLILNINELSIADVKLSIIILLFSELIAGFGLIVMRALYVFKYYPPLSWIGIIFAIGVPFLQIIFVTKGFELIELSILTLTITTLYYFFFNIHCLKLIRKKKINFINIFFFLNCKHLINSSYVMIGDVFEKIKGEGVRIILLPFLGTLQMITYMTIKTANGLINQFFQAFSNAFFIEYADYLNKKDKKKFLTSYIVIYVVICFLIIPSAFFLQLIINPLFDIWTKNKISFDPILFALFTSSFLMMIFYTPSLLIIKGKNLFKKYMHITVLANIVYLILISILVNIYTLIGAGISLLILETILCLSFFYYANKWLKNNFIEFKYKIILFYGLDLVISIMFILLLGAEIFNVFYITLAFTIFKLLYGISFLKLAPDEVKSILYYFNKR